MISDEYFMSIAIKEAQKAAKKDEVPVGAVIDKDEKIIARAHNLREHKKDPSAHAEFIAMTKAAKKLGGWRLLDCTLYVTLEPCPMCAGLIINSYDKKAGALGSVYNLNEGKLNHKCILNSGIMQEQCSSIIKNYFIKKRGKKML